MNKNEVLEKKNIIMYAKKIRDIQENHINPYISLIASHLSNLYPSLSEDQTSDWALDIMNADSNSEVLEVLERVENILNANKQKQNEEQKKNQWVCCVCGKNTFDVDSDYLFGVNHMSCLLTEEIKSNQNHKFELVKKELSEIKDVIRRLDNKLNELKSNE